MMVLLSSAILSCSPGEKPEGQEQGKEASSVVKRYRDDGTLSSVSQVDKNDYVHGVKVNYYEDGKTVHSKVSYEHGRKHGPALWYYKNGQVYEHTSFHYGRRQGLTKKYYDTGELMEELMYDQGEVQPGEKKYNRRGELISE